VTTHERFREFMPDQRSFFDELITNDWPTYISAEWDLTRTIEAREVLRRAPARRVIDIGCGCGFHDRVLADHPGVAHVVGIDYSEKSIETAEREYPHARVTRRTVDVDELPPGDFDLAVSFHVIEHVVDPVAFLRTCRGQVAPGGRVAVVTPNRLRMDNAYRSLRGYPLLREDRQHFREYTIRDLKRLGERADLRYESSFGYGLSFTAPVLERQVIPWRAGIDLGRFVPSLAFRIGVVFRRD
jgi:SAM-dependent methyltransferase